MDCRHIAVPRSGHPDRATISCTQKDPKSIECSFFSIRHKTRWPQKKSTKTSITIISCLSENILNFDDDSPKLIVQWNLNTKKTISFNSYFFHKQKKITLDITVDSSNNVSIPLKQLNENLAHITILPYVKTCFTIPKIPTLEKKENHSKLHKTITARAVTRATRSPRARSLL